MSLCDTVLPVVRVAQLDRASASEAEGRVFESRHGHFPMVNGMAKLVGRKSPPRFSGASHKS